MIEINNFELGLKIEFNKIWSYCKSDSNKEWTFGVKKILININDLFFQKKIATSSFDNSDSGEWLVDFMIYEENEKFQLNKILLSAEIEWRNFLEYLPQIKYDFEKLLAIKSKIKLFIFEVENTIELTTYFINLQENFKNFSSINNWSDKELFYLIIWNRDTQIFEVLNLK